MNDNELHFYSNKLKAFFLLIISFAVIVCAFVTWEVIIDFSDNALESSILLLVIILSFFGVVISFILLFRSKPLLSINNRQIIIYDIFRKPIFLELKEIKSFELFELRSRYSINREILIELKKPSKKAQSSFYYRLLKRFSVKIANTRYSIKIQFIKVNRNELMDILNRKLQRKRKLKNIPIN